jgi:hypothetical protein
MTICASFSEQKISPFSSSALWSKRTRLDHAVDLAWIFGSDLDPGNAGIITLTPNVGLSWDSIQSDPLRHRRGRWHSTSCYRPRLSYRRFLVTA